MGNLPEERQGQVRVFQSYTSNIKQQESHKDLQTECPLFPGKGKQVLPQERRRQGKSIILAVNFT